MKKIKNLIYSFCAEIIFVICAVYFLENNMAIFAYISGVLTIISAVNVFLIGDSIETNIKNFNYSDIIDFFKEIK